MMPLVADVQFGDLDTVLAVLGAKPFSLRLSKVQA